uniref:Cytochrome P450 n=1 Tax=Salix viminalis TaxID=40686 RepID=A0A6N2N491_SALVM
MTTWVPPSSVFQFNIIRGNTFKEHFTQHATKFNHKEDEEEEEEEWKPGLCPLVSLCFCALLQSLFTRLKPTNRHSLPPGPTAIPIISSLSWLLKSFSELEPILRSLRAKYGPVVTLHIGSRPAVFIATHSLAHQALVQNGAVFADRPPAFATSRSLVATQLCSALAFYGPTWRLLRRNHLSEILHPSRVKSYSHARRWVLDILINSLSLCQHPINACVSKIISSMLCFAC